MSATSQQNYTATASLTGHDPNVAYEFQVRITDKLTTTESAVKVIRTIPLIVIRNGQVDVQGTLSVMGVSILDIAHPIGSAIISTNDVNPGESLGGTWSAGTSVGSGLYTWVRTA